MKFFYKIVFCCFFWSVMSNADAQIDALTVDNSGSIGIGTTSPNEKLHLKSSGDAQFLIEDNSSISSERTLLRLLNKGKTRFVIGNGKSIWTFDSAAASFQINKAGTGVNEFRVEEDGDIVALGKSIATQHVNTSSRKFKEGFTAVDTSDILNRLMSLSISKWRYKNEPEDSYHIGPVAEDFQSVFGFSDGNHISTIDADGISLAAIQALNRQLQEYEQEIATLKKINGSLEQRLSIVEEFIVNLGLKKREHLSTR